MLSDNNIVMGFSIGGFLPCLHIQERGLKQSCSQFTKAGCLLGSGYPPLNVESIVNAGGNLQGVLLI